MPAALIVAGAVAGAIAIGLAISAAAITTAAEAAAGAIGYTATFGIPIGAVTGAVLVVVSAIVFIGLVYLLDWLNRKYTISLQIQNWDKDNDWELDGAYYNNAVIAGDKERKFEPITIPKVVDGPILPPGFLPVEPVDTVRYYAEIVWENDNTFMEGCSMALRLRKKGTNQGFMWAFSCPRFSDNKQAAKDGLSDPEEYYDDLEWNENPEKFTISTTDAKIPVTCSVNALSGAKDNLYEVYNTDWK